MYSEGSEMTNTGNSDVALVILAPVNKVIFLIQRPSDDRKPLLHQSTTHTQSAGDNHRLIQSYLVTQTRVVYDEHHRRLKQPLFRPVWISPCPEV